jgi:OOP family OmpA-OmpF porin
MTTLTSRKFVGTKGKLSLLTLALMATPFAMAEDSGGYVGANYGHTQASIDDTRIRNDLLNSGLTTNSIKDDDDDQGYKLFGGYQLNRHFAVEAGYFDLGRFGFVASTTPTGTLSGNIKVKGVNLDLLGIMPISERFSAFGRIGVTHARTDGAFAGTGAVTVLDPSPSKRDTNPKVGLGLQYAMTDSLGLRAEIERYRINDAVGNKGDIDLASVGLVFRFGAKTPAPVAQAYTPAPTPAPVVVAETPAPVYVAPPAPTPPPAPVVHNVTFSAGDLLFDFDSAALRPEGRSGLDKLGSDLRGVDIDAVNVTGHTDRIGSQTYNQALSSRRAETVGNYLGYTAGIPASKINTKGVNSTEPVTKPEDCVGTKVTPALIACLQPDRRVEVEVTGKR